jgi:hypothetical protein
MRPWNQDAYDAIYHIDICYILSGAHITSGFLRWPAGRPPVAGEHLRRWSALGRLSLASGRQRQPYLISYTYYLYVYTLIYNSFLLIRNICLLQRGCSCWLHVPVPISIQLSIFVLVAWGLGAVGRRLAIACLAIACWILFYERCMIGLLDSSKADSLDVTSLGQSPSIFACSVRHN